MSLLAEIRDTADDSWTGSMEERRDHLGHMVLDAVRSTGEIPTKLPVYVKRYNTKGRKRSDALDRATFWQRLAKFIQFTYCAILIFCGITPMAVAAAQDQPHYLLWTVMVMLVPPMWLAENYAFNRGYMGRHSFANKDDRVRLYREVAH